MKPERFLTVEQQETVVAAVRLAEKGTSGEIRIHIDGNCATDAMTRAQEVFGKLGMHKTKLRNGVLIYLACNTKVFAIIGDKGINDILPENFWEDAATLLRQRFRKGQYTEGLSEVAIMIGEKLKEHFPIEPDDINEQPDETSFG